MNHKLLLAALLLAIALTGIAMRHQLTNAAPNSHRHLTVCRFGSRGVPGL